MFVQRYRAPQTRKARTARSFTHSPGPKTLLTMFGAKHALGGVSGYDVAETQDQDSERLGVVQRLTWAYLRTALYPNDSAWSVASEAFSSTANPQGKTDFKS